MNTNCICFCKEIEKKKYTGCNLKTTKLLESALIGACVVIRMKTVNKSIKIKKLLVRNIVGQLKNGV